MGLVSVGFGGVCGVVLGVVLVRGGISVGVRCIKGQQWGPSFCKK